MTKLITIALSADILAQLALESRRRGIRLEDLASAKLAGAVLEESGREHEQRRESKSPQKPK